MNNKKCPCCSGKLYFECCQPIIHGEVIPKNPEELMRSRYSAYSVGNVDYLYNTTAKKEQKYYSKKEIEGWASENDWLKLEIMNSNDNMVEFKAFHKLKNSFEILIHHEKSTFVLEGNHWKYLSGEFFDEK